METFSMADLAASALREMTDAELVEAVQDELSRRQIPHTIWTPSALRDVAQHHYYAADMTPEEMERALEMAQTTDEWRELSEPTVQHHVLVSQAFEQGAHLATRQKVGTP